MSKIKLMYRDILPCWYELSWDAESVGIILRIHREFILARDPSVIADAPITQTYQERFGLGEFSSDFLRDIGFSQSIIQLGRGDDFYEYFIKIPSAKFYTNIECEYCHGTGKGNFNDRCYRCHEGKEVDIDWRKAIEIGASFAILSRYLQTTSVKTSAKFPQLFVVTTALNSVGRDGAPIHGDVAVPSVEWLGRFIGREIDAVREAVMIAYDRIFGIRSYNKGEFRACINGINGRFIIDCPGDACGIGCGCAYAPQTDRPPEGFTFACHNPDSVLQQLSLLSGLAALHDIVRNCIAIK